MTAGSRTYPVGYSYDSQGRLKTMTNWSSLASLAGARVTTWNYNTRGFLTNKVYQGTNGPLYSYSPAGRLQSRTWARGIDTSYTNNSLGDLTGVYSNGSAAVSYGFDRVGRRTNILDEAGSRLLAYNDAGLPLSETNTSGTMAGIGLVYQYDQYLRKTNVQVWGTNGLILSHSYGFDAAGRLKTVSDGTVTAGYSYLADSPLIGQMFLTNSGVLKNTTTKTYDHLNRLLAIQTVTSKTNLLSSNYSYNDANQRKGNRLQDGSYWVYDYDDLGQVTSGKRYWEDGTPVAGQQFEYTFDDIGNRTSTKAGGDSSGGSLRSATYGANLLNQYTNRTVPGAMDVMGIANASATVTVNGQSTYREGEYYQALVNVANSSTNVFQKITNVATLSGVTNQVSGGTIVPVANQPFRYDPDGNLTNDGVFTYIWDHENRLLFITNNGMAGLPAQKITITYDSQGRRIRYLAQTNNAGTFVNAKFVRYVYDGWNLLAELNATNNAVINTYLWGADLSGTLQGAGGVGGLVAVKNLSLGYHAPAYDGNGNVVALVDSGTGSSGGALSASYEYGPFGEVIRASGSAGSINPFRFSTKYQDEETGLLYFGLRYYNASIGRWQNRDPIGELGGLNTFGFVNNRPVSKVDYLGLKTLQEGNIEEIKTDNKGRILGGLVYSCNCGWLDGEHMGGLIPPLMSRTLGQMNDYEAEPGSSFVRLDVEKRKWGIGLYGANMIYKLTYTGTPSPKDKIGTAMGMVLYLSKVYEKAQDYPFVGPGTDSSFSVEDLPSNYLGALIFAEEKFPGTGVKWDDVKRICDVLSPEESKVVLREGGPMENTSFSPKIWNCGPCKNRKSPNQAAAQQLFKLYDLNAYGKNYKAIWSSY